MRAYTQLTAEFLANPKVAERRVRVALTRSGGHIGAAAEELKVSRATLSAILSARPRLKRFSADRKRRI